MLEIYFNSVVLALCYNVLIKQGELFQFWARIINLSNWNDYVKKMLLCPYCFGGQLALWQCIYFWEGWQAIPLTIITIYYIVNYERNK